MLVAIAILASALAVLLPTFSGGTRTLIASQAVSVALMRAQSQLDEVSSELTIAPDHRSGTYTDGSRWTATIDAYEPDPLVEDPGRSGFALMSVEITVTAVSGRSVTLTTLRPAP